MVEPLDPDPTVEQIRAFANGLNPNIGPGFGQDVVALCDDHARLTAQLSECEQALALYEAENAKMTEELARVQEVRDALAALDGLPTGTPLLSAKAGDTDG
jgi:hypothetical protein